MEPKLELLENEKILAQDKIKGKIGTIVAGVFLFIFGIVVVSLSFAEILPKFSFDYIYYILAGLFFSLAIILIVFGIIKYLQQPRLYVTNMRVFGETYLSQGLSKYFATFSIPLSKITYLSTSSFKNGAFSKTDSSLSIGCSSITVVFGPGKKTVELYTKLLSLINDIELKKYGENQ